MNTHSSTGDYLDPRVMNTLMLEADVRRAAGGVLDDDLLELL